MKIRKKVLLDQRYQNLVLGMPDENDVYPYLEAFRLIFGEPGLCLTCGKEDRKGKGDICEWFCSQHCPACDRN